jgi:hypothetical protein
MRRDPYDWDAFHAAASPRGVPLDEVVLGLLGRLPERRAMTLADVGDNRLDLLPLLLSGFGRVVSIIDPEVLWPAESAWNVVLALEPMSGADLAALDRRLSRFHDGLAEGGLLLAAFHASPRGGARRAMGLRRPMEDPATNGGLLELEAQYRLRRAGFRGIRLRRFESPEEASVLLALAVRRADN